jgi:hypothetical protein
MRPMHASIWKFTGDPEALLRGYDALIAEFGSEVPRLHLCLRAPDGIVFVDTCPTASAFAAFAADDGFRARLGRHGLGQPESVEDYPVHVAYVDGQARREPAATTA